MTEPTAPEPWVDVAAVAKHIGFCERVTRRKAEEGKIPGRPIRQGKKTFWRFQLSAVDTAIKEGLAE